MHKFNMCAQDHIRSHYISSSHTRLIRTPMPSRQAAFLLAAQTVHCSTIQVSGMECGVLVIPP